MENFGSLRCREGVTSIAWAVSGIQSYHAGPGGAAVTHSRYANTFLQEKKR